MCKIAGTTKITDANREKVWKFMMLLGEQISLGNNDGLGYAAIDSKGAIFGERWLRNDTAFLDISKIIPSLTAEKMSKLYSFFGDTVNKNDAQGIILHTRMATCGKGIENTHPFVDDIDNPSLAIIHNGIIQNHFQFTKKYSTCDSEVIATLYKENKVNEDFASINKVTNQLAGWYTVLALSKDADGRLIMDAFTDGERLHSFFIPELDTRVYSTRAYDIEVVAKELGMTCTDGKRFLRNTAARIDVLTGGFIDSCKTEEYKEKFKGSRPSWFAEFLGDE
jgi:hypothetical protein